MKNPVLTLNFNDNEVSYEVYLTAIQVNRTLVDGKLLEDMLRRLIDETGLTDWLNSNELTIEEANKQYT